MEVSEIRVPEPNASGRRCRFGRGTRTDFPAWTDGDVPPEAEGFTFQNHLFRVRPNELSDARFIAAYVNSQGGRRYFGSFGGTTSGLNTVSAANVKALPLPLPGMSEQQAIAAALDGVDSAIEVAREERAGATIAEGVRRRRAADGAGAVKGVFS